jgi:hypothetical protein
MLTTTERVRLIFAGALSFFGCFALVGVGFAGFQAREAAITLQNDADNITASTVARMNELQAPIHESRQLLRDGRLTLDNVNKAAIDERLYLEKQLPTTLGRFDALLDAANATVSSVQPVTAAATRSLDETTARLHDLQPVESGAAKMIADADVLVSDPHIAEAAAHADDATAALASTAKHLDGTAADTQEAVHKFLHPSWGVRIANWMGQAVHAAGGWF